MPIERCTITGPDNQVNFIDLNLLGQEYPFLEWAILFSDTRAGSPRYPTREWIDDFLVRCPHVKKALHLCGNTVLQFAAGDPGVIALARKFDRVQINFSASHKKYAHVAEQLPIILKELDMTGVQFILQDHQGNAGIIDQFLKLPNCEVLFDGSGGNGVRPDSWPLAHPDVKCGYAGGLGPDSLEHEMPAIEAAAGESPCWIDMETGVRDESDCFDLVRVYRVLETVDSHINRN